MSTDERFLAFVRCAGDSVPGQQSCGLVGLTEHEYLRQLDKPDVGWWCPHCGSSAQYDDTASEEAQGVSDDGCNCVLSDDPDPQVCDLFDRDEEGYCFTCGHAERCHVE